MTVEPSVMIQNQNENLVYIVLSTLTEVYVHA